MPEDPPTISLWERVALHLLPACLMTFMVATHRLDIQKGICWEAYVIWASVMLSRAILQAAYFTISLPAESYVPEFGKPVIEGILPIVGETLDIFKDWMFVGIAVHTQTLLGCMFAYAGLVILLLSNVWLLWYHAEASASYLLPVHAACKTTKEPFFVKHTSPAKLAIALTEDLPQAVMQSAFVVFFGGSPTQFLFIGVSLTKIILCFSLRAVALERENRHGESWLASVDYYNKKIAVSRFFLGDTDEWVLKEK